MKEEEKPSKVLVAITTDGLENSSNEYSYSSIKSLIEEKKKLGWDFIFLGANIDAIGEANKFGIERDMAMNIKATKVGQNMLLNPSIERHTMLDSQTPFHPIGKIHKKSIYQKKRKKMLV